ncbi:MAG: Do family serine endopeptidase [Ignavibacteriaceae bacterium]|nr:Do family serine endopeptidase [Ignavibacteriaceae bacterium]
MKSKKLFGAFALIAIGIILGAVLVSGFGWIRPGFAGINLGAKNPPVNLNVDANSFSQAFIEVADKVTPSIVQISVVSKNENDPHKDFFFFPFRDFEMPKEQQGSGSGIIMSEDGYILTNNHVVENATQITVQLFDKRKFDGKVIGTDPLTDLAVIKINSSGLPLAYLGDSDKLKVGQWVMAIGNPLSLASTVTAGIISALNRGQLNLIKDSYGVENFIQTDAAINPGNSGGALVDLSGAVIGVNTAIATRSGTYIGYGFAIPINLAKSVAKDLIANGKISRGYIGVQIREVDAALAKSLGLDKPTGVIVEGLVDDGAAKQADVKRGDIILEIDGIQVDKPNQLQSYVASKSAGYKVKLLLWRDGKKVEKTVTLKPKNEQEEVATARNEEKESKEDNSGGTVKFDNIGLTVKNMTSREREQYKIENGVMISSVEAFGKAQTQGLGTGLVITKADKKEISNVNELKSIIDRKKGQAVLIEVVDRQGTSRFVGIEIPE